MGKVWLGAVLGMLVLGMAACGGDDGGTEPQVLSFELTSTSGGSFQVTGGGPVEAGLVRVEYRNGTEEQADAQLIRMDDGHTLEEALTVIGSEGGVTPGWLHAEGGAGQIAAGATGIAELVLDEGTYYLVDVGEPEGDDVPSHAESGATATIEVSGGDDDAELPDVDASIEMADYNFVTDGLKAGANRFLLSNTGKEIHHTLIVPIEEGANFGDVREFLTTEGEPSGPPPVDFSQLTGTSALDGGREQIAELELAAGRYAFLCFITDRAGGPPHVVKGMLREVTIEE
jgi:hypothetical protein